MSEAVATRPRRPAPTASAIASEGSPGAPPEENQPPPAAEPAEVPLTDPPSTEEPPPPIAATHFDMEHAPKDGSRIVLVSKSGAKQIAVWRVSRRFESKVGRWTHQEFWADPLNAHAPIAFNPIGWLEDEWKAPQ